MMASSSLWLARFSSIREMADMKSELSSSSGSSSIEHASKSSSISIELA